jgi:hypothetical protein
MLGHGTETLLAAGRMLSRCEAQGGELAALLNTLASPTVATSAVAVTGPTPSIFINRWVGSLSAPAPRPTIIGSDASIEFA